MRRTLIVFLRLFCVVALIGSMSACGGDSDDEPQAQEEPAAAEETEPAEETAEEPAESDDDLTAFCDAANAMTEAESGLLEDLEKAAGDPAATEKAYKKFLAQTEEHLDAMAESAPDDLQQAAEAYAESYRASASGDLERGSELNQKGLEVVTFARTNC